MSTMPRLGLALGLWAVSGCAVRETMPDKIEQPAPSSKFQEIKGDLRGGLSYLLRIQVPDDHDPTLPFTGPMGSGTGLCIPYDSTSPASAELGAPSEDAGTSSEGSSYSEEGRRHKLPVPQPRAERIRDREFPIDGGELTELIRKLRLRLAGHRDEWGRVPALRTVRVLSPDGQLRGYCAKDGPDRAAEEGRVGVFRATAHTTSDLPTPEQYEADALAQVPFSAELHKHENAKQRRLLGERSWQMRHALARWYRTVHHNPLVEKFRAIAKKCRLVKPGQDETCDVALAFWDEQRADGKAACLDFERSWDEYVSTLSLGEQHTAAQLVRVEKASADDPCVAFVDRALMAVSE